MICWTYDKTFEGFLTLVFDAYDLKLFPDKILGKNSDQPMLFAADYEVISDEEKAKRVWFGLKKKLSALSRRMIYRVFLSELEDIELLLLNYVRTIFEAVENMEMNFGNRYVLEMVKISKKVSRETQRILMFVRFQKTADDIYYASFDPQYNVLPLSTRHFKERFADQKWVIYDTRRNFGFYYDLKEVSEITFTHRLIDKVNGKIDKSIMAEDEQKFQQLWKSYFDSVCIRERINPRLHMQFLPKRFWKYLTEKQ